MRSAVGQPSAAAEWRNWSGEQVCRPVRIERPGGVDAVADAVRRAAADGLRVKAAGSGHSFTSAALTDGVLLDLSALDRVLATDADELGARVRVQAGITLRALNERLAERGLALENLGDIDAQTLAGALATGTHGTGARLGNLSAQVEAIELVDGRGQVRELAAPTVAGGGAPAGGDDPGDADADALRAARVSLGALGVITAVTLRCVPAYVLRGVDTTAPLERVLAALDEHADAHRHFELYAFPHAGRAITRANDIVDELPRPPGRAATWVKQRLVETHALRAVSGLGARRRGLIPALNRLAPALAGTSVRVDRSDRVFASPREVRFVELEYAYPRAAAADALRAILAAIERERLAVNFPIELRFAAGDDALLSPAHERDSAYIAVHVSRGMPWERYFRTVEAIADAHAGRPHWGKRHFQRAATLAPRYPRWDAFAAVRARLDPDGRFANDYVDHVLGPLRADG